MKEGTQREKKERRESEGERGEKNSRDAGSELVCLFRILFLRKVSSAPLPSAAPSSSFAASLHSPIFPSSISVQSFLFIASLVSSHDGGERVIPDMQRGKGRVIWSGAAASSGLSGEMERVH